MRPRDSVFMAEAVRLSLENVRGGGGPFGAVLVREGKILATGRNEVTSANDPTAHAEVVAIRNACRILGTFHLQGCRIYTSCEPCPMCLGAIYWARLEAVCYAGTRQDAAVHGFADLFIYQEMERPAGKRRLPMRQMMREEALAAFEAWAAKTDRAEY